MLNKLTFVLCCVLVNSLYEGDPCIKDGEAGVCTNVWRCQAALNDLKNGGNPELCSYQGQDSIVCCVEQTHPHPTTSSRPPAPLTTPAITTTTKKEPGSTHKLEDKNYYDYEYPEYEEESCGPIPAHWTKPKNGRKAWDKCVEYQESLVFPCERGVILTGALSRMNKCHHNAEELIVGGLDAAENEFPHMVMIGYGAPTEIEWLCGGSIISESFILSAGHCAYVRNLGSPVRVAAGILTRSQISNSTRIHEVKRIVRHPKYTPLKKYHDIALIELRTPLVLDQYTVPACLDMGAYYNDGRALATGWGLTLYKGSASEVLQKVVLNKFTNERCSSLIPPSLHMEDGFDPVTQLCYGDDHQSKDTCQGDSGGPLQIKSRELNCMYVIVGVTSSGGGCGDVGDAGVYSLVNHYTPWIESVVWPDA